MHEGKPSVKPPNREDPANRLCSASMDHISVAQMLLPFVLQMEANLILIAKAFTDSDFDNEQEVYLQIFELLHV